MTITVMRARTVNERRMLICASRSSDALNNAASNRSPSIGAVILTIER